MKKLKQIFAIGTIVIILGLYLLTLVLSLLGNTLSDSLFKASLYATVVVPLMLYIILWLTKLFRGDDKQ